jgi:hypothetical protein
MEQKPDTNDKIRSTLVTGLLNPWVGLAFLAGFIAGWLSKWIAG